MRYCLENIYLSRYIDTATGASLDRLAPFAGITRNPASRAILTLIVLNNGTGTTTIPMGTKFRTESGILFHAVSETVIQPSRFANITLECDDMGEIGNISDSELSFFNTQISNVFINKIDTFTDGSETESDVDLRARWKNALSGSSSGTADAIIGKINRISGVASCTVVENTSDDTIGVSGGDGTAIPPHSFLTSVCASSDTSEMAIARAILDSKPLGIGTSGKTTVTVTDSAGISHAISFTINQTMTPSFFVYISGTDEPDFDLETDGAAIRKAIVDYVNKDIETFGRTIYASELYAPITEVTGIRSIKQITLGFTESSGASATAPDGIMFAAKESNIRIYVV